MSPADDRRDRPLEDLIADYADALRAGAYGEQPAGLGADAENARAVVRMLQAELGPGHFLDPVDPARTVAYADPSEAPAADGVPARVGRFRPLRELGRGGFGIVYLALDPVLRREVALKVPRAEALLTPELRQRFVREARAAGSLDHPNVVPVYEAGEDGPVCYIASAYCPGSNLAEYLRGQPEPPAPRPAAGLVAALADAVQHAHDRGILHRDLKPANVILAPADDPLPGGLPFAPRLTDFGLARLAESSLEETGSSVILGTPLYMAPEQAEARAAAVGPPTDVYALGAILYECLTGGPPFLGRTLVEVLDRVRSEEPEPPSRLRPEVPRDLETICLKCLEKEPGRRYAAAGELAADLRRFLNGEPIAARRPGLLGRLNAWSLRRERIRDAALLAIAVNTVAGAYPVLIYVGLILGLGSRPQDFLLLALQSLALILGLNVPSAWAGLRVLAGRRWALWAGLGMSLLKLGVAVVILTVPPTDVGGRYDGFADKWNVFSLLMMLFFLETVGYALALRAHSHLRRAGYFSPV